MGRELVAYMDTSGPAFVGALNHALRGGPAVLPMPPGPPAATHALLAAMRPHAVRDADGRRHACARPLACADDVVAVVATSGTSGQPKGVELSDACLRASARATSEAIGSGVWLACLPACHIAGLQVRVRTLLAGEMPVTGALGARGAAYVSVVPAQLQRSLAQGIDLTHFQAVLVGGAATPAWLLDDARRAGIRIVTTYGMTETSGGCVYDGLPLRGVAVTLDEDGRIDLAGPPVARGYRDGARFAERRFQTRDLGRFAPDGRLEVLGRVDDVIVTGGLKAHPQAIEAWLGEHAGVGLATVLGVPDPEWGQRIVAVVVPRDPRDPPTLAALRDHVRDRAPAWMAPRELRCVASLPRLASGKVDRRRVASMLASAGQDDAT